MAMYTITVISLIHRLEHSGTKQVWHADDATAAGKLAHLKTWWNSISELGPGFGYYLNASKTLLIIKDGYYEEAVTTFQETGVSITAEGRRHLFISTPTFAQIISLKFLQNHVVFTVIFFT